MHDYTSINKSAILTFIPKPVYKYSKEFRKYHVIKNITKGKIDMQKKHLQA